MLKLALEELSINKGLTRLEPIEKKLVWLNRVFLTNLVNPGLPEYL